MYRLENEVRPYAWGSTTAIAELLGREPSGGPEAELWIGAHPGAPSRAVLTDGSQLRLDELIARDPLSTLGGECRRLFGNRLPFLAKILAAGRPLSLQVHPTIEQARAGFAAEEAAGVDSSAAERNYKDDNHKPEMIFALTDFQALCGFRPAAESAAIFAVLRNRLVAARKPVPGLLDAVAADLTGAEADHDGGSPALRAAFSRLITAGDDAAAAVDAVVDVLGDEPLAGAYGKELTTVQSLAREYPGDPGVLLSLLLNRVSLAPGEALYLPAGNVHAYLSGLGVEVMASSDNVLRGGLTPKFVDVPELLRTVDFRSLPLPLVEPVTTPLDEHVWAPPFDEFQLQRVELGPHDSPVPLTQHGPLVLISIAGAATVDTPRDDLSLERGQSIFVPANESPVLLHPANAATEPAIVFAVTVNASASGPSGLS